MPLGACFFVFVLPFICWGAVATPGHPHARPHFVFTAPELTTGAPSAPLQRPTLTETLRRLALASWCGAGAPAQEGLLDGGHAAAGQSIPAVLAVSLLAPPSCWPCLSFSRADSPTSLSIFSRIRVVRLPCASLHRLHAASPLVRSPAGELNSYVPFCSSHRSIVWLLRIGLPSRLVCADGSGCIPARRCALYPDQAPGAHQALRVELRRYHAYALEVAALALAASASCWLRASLYR